MNAHDLWRAAELADEFTITDEHLVLLRHARISWQDTAFGAPAINPQRPYGNSRTLAGIAALLAPDAALDADDEAMDAYIEANADRLARLHAETGVALQICLQVGEFRAGRYRKADWSHWERIEETPEPARSPDA